VHSCLWLELVTAEFGHLFLSCTRSFTADLSKGCSEARNKLIVLSIKLVAASGPCDWINDQIFQGDCTAPQECVFLPEAPGLWEAYEATLVSLQCAARLSSPEDDGPHHCWVLPHALAVLSILCNSSILEQALQTC